MDGDKNRRDEDNGIQFHIDQKYGKGQTKLHKAAMDDNVDECRNLLSRGANINCTDKWRWSPLMAAAVKGYLPTCVLLTDSGADVHLTSNDGNTALSLAAHKGCHDVVDHLIKQQANINTTKGSLQKK